MRQRAGRIHAASKKLEVKFEPVEGGEINNKIDEAYRIKYEGSPYLSPMISERARSATVRINPLSTNG